MKKLVLVFGILSLLSCSNEDNDISECYKNVYLKDVLQQSEFYSNDYNDHGKVIFTNGVQMVKIECN